VVVVVEVVVVVVVVSGFDYYVESGIWSNQ
jgi:hypothetical protein